MIRTYKCTCFSLLRMAQQKRWVLTQVQKLTMASSCSLAGQDEGLLVQNICIAQMQWGSFQQLDLGTQLTMDPGLPSCSNLEAWTPQATAYYSPRCRSFSPSSHPHPRSGWLRHSPAHGPGSLCSHTLPTESLLHTDESLRQFHVPRSLQQLPRAPCACPVPPRLSIACALAWFTGHLTYLPASPVCPLLVLACAFAHPSLLQVLQLWAHGTHGSMSGLALRPPWTSASTIVSPCRGNHQKLSLIRGDRTGSADWGGHSWARGLMSLAHTPPAPSVPHSHGMPRPVDPFLLAHLGGSRPSPGLLWHQEWLVQGGPSQGCGDPPAPPAPSGSTGMSCWWLLW